MQTRITHDKPHACVAHGIVYKTITKQGIAYNATF